MVKILFILRRKIIFPICTLPSKLGKETKRKFLHYEGHIRASNDVYAEGNGYSY